MWLIGRHIMGSRRLVTMSTHTYFAPPRYQLAVADSQFYFALSTGYFLWDLIVSLWQGWGIGFVAHAVACLFVYSMSLHPFLHYHGMFFLMYEASTPFLHMRWYLLHTGRRDGTAMAVVQVRVSRGLRWLRLRCACVRLCLCVDGTKPLSSVVD